LHAQRPGEGGEVSAIDRVTIAQQISGHLVPGKRFPDLLHRPLLSGMFRHLEMQHAASGLGEDFEDK